MTTLPASGFLSQRPAHCSARPVLTQLLTEGASPAVLIALLSTSAWRPEEALEDVGGGEPALGRWVRGRQGGSQMPWNAAPWPTDATGDWAAVRLQPPFQGHVWESAQAEWVVGFLVSKLPEGLLKPWTPVSRHGVALPESASDSLLALAVERHWFKAVDQLLRRPDAPTPAEASALGVVGAGAQIHVLQSYDTGLVGTSDYNNEVNRPGLLSHAVASGHLFMVDRLLEHGLSLDTIDATGVPAWYQARNVATLKHLLPHVKDKNQHATLPISPASWWGKALGSLAAATPLITAVSQWQLRALPAQEREAAAFAALLHTLETSTRPVFVEEAKKLKVDRKSRFPHAGREWNLSEYAQFQALQARTPPDTRERSALNEALDWVPAQESLAPGLSASDALWWLGGYWPRAHDLTQARSQKAPRPESLAVLLEQWQEWLGPKAPPWVVPYQQRLTKSLGHWALPMVHRRWFVAFQESADIAASPFPAERHKALLAATDLARRSGHGLLCLQLGVECLNHAIARTAEGNVALADPAFALGWETVAALAGDPENHQGAAATEAAVKALREVLARVTSSLGPEALPPRELWPQVEAALKMPWLKLEQSEPLARAMALASALDPSHPRSRIRM